MREGTELSWQRVRDLCWDFVNLKFLEIWNLLSRWLTVNCWRQILCHGGTYNVDSCNVIFSLIRKSWRTGSLLINADSNGRSYKSFRITRNVQQVTLMQWGGTTHNALLFQPGHVDCFVADLTGNVATTRWATHYKSLGNCRPKYWGCSKASCLEW